MIRSTLTIGLTGLLLAGCATRMPAPEVAPSPAAIQDLSVHEGSFTRIQEFTTASGVSVWLVTESAIPIVSVQMAWRGGRAADPDGLEGIGNAVAYAMNEGAGELDSLAFQTAMEDLNMSFGCSISNQWTNCSASMLAENVQDSMALVALAFAEPRFDEAPFERFLREQEVSLRTRETNPNYLAWRTQAQTLYPGHVFAREVSAESLAALSREGLRAHKASLFPRDRLLVTAVGAITPDELGPLIDALVSGLPGTAEFTPVEPVSLPETAPSSALTVPLPQPQSLVRFIGPGVSRDDPDFFPAFVLNYVFGGGNFESRLMRTLRVERGLTYGISAGLDPTPSFQNWAGGGQTKNESAGEFIAGIQQEMRKLAREGVTENELSDAKAYLIGSYPLGFDSNAKIAGQMMSVRQDELGIGYFDLRNALIEAVTLEAVNRVAASYLAPERFTFIVVGEPQGLE